jgi:hypothetical protein
MTVSASSTEGKRLDRSVQTGIDQTEFRVSPVTGARNPVQLVHRMPEPQSGLAKRLDPSAERRQHKIDGVLLGECRLMAKICTYATDLEIKGYATADLAAGASKKCKKDTLVKAYAESPNQSNSF